MPRVPTLDNQVQTKTAPVSTSGSPRPPVEAFGANVANAKSGFMDTVNKIGDMVVRRGIELQQREDDKQVLLNDVAFRREMQGILTDQTPDEKDRPKGFLVRQLGQAKDSTVEFDKAYEPLREKYLKNVSSNGQKTALMGRMDSHYLAARDSVIQNEAKQREQDFTNVAQSNLEQSVSDAALISDPKILAQEIATAQQTLAVAKKHFGADDKSIALATQIQAGRMVKSAVTAHLEKDYNSARKILNTFRKAIPEPLAAKLQAQVDGKALSDEQLGAWTRVSGPEFRMADGFYDNEKQRAAIMALPNIPTDRKEALVNYSLRMAGVEDANTRDRRNNLDRTFTNTILDAHKQGMPYAEAQKLVPAYSWDSKNQVEKEKELYDLYTGDKTAFVERQWEKASPEQKAVMDRIEKILAPSTYGNESDIAVEGFPNKVNMKDLFVSEMKQSLIGKSPDEMWAIAQEKIKTIPVGKKWVFFDKMSPVWTRDAASRNAVAAAMGQLKMNYGDEIVSQATDYVVSVLKMDPTPKNIGKVIEEQRNAALKQVGNGRGNSPQQ